ncbi:Protein kinase-like domain protein [Niveomyces insectorum RCEF 264]|uniref:non-specific serine/threonine protein kinase n=1 Tax=Niveomyces insectorum RCEF 264 TaxID=1081102 RepID=A0A167NRB8_9HYPO|nr:Protein kinase-like domain protein [Niveomyces insectorum RCEF 264]
MPFTAVFRRPSSFSSRKPEAPEVIAGDVLVDEESVPGYKPERFYPANPEDLLEGRYRLKAKIGWGSSSTVWLAQDISRNWLKPNRYIAVKICTCGAADDESHSHELDMTKHITSVDSSHRGSVIIANAIESFGVSSPQGEHLALVFEPMRDPLWMFRRRIAGGNQVTGHVLGLFKAYLKILLEGLDFLHAECHVIHTDLKLDNIMVTFENDAVIEAFVRAQALHPMARKQVGGGRTVYRCHNNFGAIADDKALRMMYPKITDLGLAQRGDRPTPLLHPIQPDYCQAPEVLLGTGWRYSADMWNFGVMVWELLTGRSLFAPPMRAPSEPAEPYAAVAHLADMVALLGPMPPELVRREKLTRHWRWQPEIRNAQGALCNSAAAFFGGPFLTEEGTFVGQHLVSQPRIWEKELPECIPPEDAEAFFRFMRRMVCWLPEERATAKELKDDPWLE